MIILEKATIVTSEKEALGSVVIDNGIIEEVLYTESDDYDYRIARLRALNPEVINLEGKHVMAGGIDAHVHFREPGLTHKADIASESAAAVAGGITTVMDMPNTSPATTSALQLKEKISLAQGRSKAKISFHIGATNDNASEICRLVREGDPATGITPADIAGVKVFMGSSTGNMLVDDSSTLEEIFKIKEKPVLVHCEDENEIKSNLALATERFGNDIPFREHENIRSRKACIKSSIKALEMAIRHNTRLVLCHLSTKEEVEMVRAAKSNNPDIIAETSCNYLWFSNEAYDKMGSKVKCNPSIKTSEDKASLRHALATGLIDTIGSDHAPHLLSEKSASYTKAPSGLPTIQHSLLVLLTVADEEEIPLTRIASVFSEKSSEIYGLNRGKIKKGYAADLVVFDYGKYTEVKAEDILSKCRWSPYEGATLKGQIVAVYIDGKQTL